MLIHYRRAIWFLALYILFAVSNLYAQSANETRVLFVGNSYTYFWNLPQTVEAMALSQDQKIIARKSTAGGASLKQHWEGKKELKTRELITNGDWDIVVIQNHSKSSIKAPKDFMIYGKKFIDLVKETGATPLLYETWAREYNPLMQEKITEAYTELARQNDIDLAPVGEVWERARNLRPDLQLFHGDESHPSPMGTYLTACVFYSVITGKPATGLPERIKTTDKDGEVLYLSIMTENNALFLQQVVDETLSEIEMTEKK